MIKNAQGGMSPPPLRSIEHTACPHPTTPTLHLGGSVATWNGGGLCLPSCLRPADGAIRMSTITQPSLGSMRASPRPRRERPAGSNRLPYLGSSHLPCLGSKQELRRPEPELQEREPRPEPRSERWTGYHTMQWPSCKPLRLRSSILSSSFNLLLIVRTILFSAAKLQLLCKQ